jgi:hypothetical protein
MSSIPFTFSLPTNCLRYVPLLTPAVKEHSCEVDESLLIWRRRGVTLIAVAATWAGLFSSASIITSLAVPILIILGVWLLDQMRAEDGADAKAVTEYLNQPAPSSSATLRIQEGYFAARSLVSKAGPRKIEVLNKMNETGSGLLRDVPNLAVFQLLLEEGANAKGIDSYGPYFQAVAAQEDPRFLQHFLRHYQPKPKDFAPNIQVNLWSDLKSLQAAELLHGCDFTPNVQNSQGRTPLMQVVITLGNFWCEDDGQCKFTIEEHVRVLLKYGADPTVTCEGKTAAQMTANPAVQAILAEAANPPG